MMSDNDDHIKLPEDLLNEIFLRSSVKSLLSAKCACRQFFDLIQNPRFKLNHFQYQKNHKKARLLIQYSEEQQRIVLFDDETLERGTYQDVDHLRLRSCFLHIEGPIHGLYCLFNRIDRIVLWNPTLMESKTIPLSHPHFFPDCNACEGNIGFGIGNSTYDYKLVLIRRFRNAIHENSQSYVTVYNLTTNTWRLNSCIFPIMEYMSIQNCTSSFLDGSCHWWAEPGVVIAFDMTEEMFRMIMGPDLSHSEPLCGYLRIYNDKVSVILRYENTVDIWVMLEEAVWIKQFSVTTLPWFSCVVGLWKNNGLFITIGRYETNGENPNCQIALYDSNTQTMRFMGPKGDPLSFRASVYYESLVSLGSESKGNRASLNTVSDFLDGEYNPFLNLYIDTSTDLVFKEGEDKIANGCEGEGTRECEGEADII